MSITLKAEDEEDLPEIGCSEEVTPSISTTAPTAVLSTATSTESLIFETTVMGQHAKEHKKCHPGDDCCFEKEEGNKYDK